MRTDDFIDATNAAATPEEVFELYERALASLGYDRILYAALAEHPIWDHVNSPCVIRSYPDDWVTYYTENGYIIKDPVRKYGPSKRTAFRWDDLARTNRLTPIETKVLREAEEAGLHNGVAVPLHGPYGEVMGVGLASSVGGVDPEPYMGLFQVLTYQFHTAFSALALPEIFPNGEVTLTPREHEILKWCAQGKSNWAIGEILNISEHGVHFHMRNILRKLNADSRVAAVVKALHQRLITF